jgi:hypothetical protein
MGMISDMGHMLLALLLVGAPRPSTSDCGAAMHKAEIAASALSVRKAVSVETLSGEFPTEDGTYECARVSFLLTPWGSMYRLRFDESTENLAFDMAVRRAVEKYEFEGSVFGMFDTKTLVFDGIYNRRSPDWEAHCAAGQCDPP